MQGFAKEFVRITKRNGEHVQGGCNHGIRLTEIDGFVTVAGLDDHHLVNGMHTQRYITVACDELSKIEFDTLTDGISVPKFDIIYSYNTEKKLKTREMIPSPDREPIQTHAAEQQLIMVGAVTEALLTSRG